MVSYILNNFSTLIVNYNHFKIVTIIEKLLLIAYPIIIESNRFDLNFAMSFGLSIVIIKNTHDLTYLNDCAGISINSNSFNQN